MIVGGGAEERWRHTKRPTINATTKTITTMAIAGETERCITSPPWLKPHFVAATTEGADTDNSGARVVSPVCLAIGAFEPLGVPVHEDRIKAFHVLQIHKTAQQAPERVIARLEGRVTKRMSVRKPIVVATGTP